MLPESTEQVVRTTRLIFSSTVSRQRGRGRSLLASFRPPVATISSSGSSGVPDLNRSVRERPTAVTREREHVASRPPKPRTVRAYRAHQYRDTLDSRQKDRHLGTAIHNCSNSNSSATKSERHTARSDRQGARVGGGAERHQVSAQTPPRRCLPPCPYTPPPSEARSAAAAPRAPPYVPRQDRSRTTTAALRLAADAVRIPYRDRARSACSRMHSDASSARGRPRARVRISTYRYSSIHSTGTSSSRYVLLVLAGVQLYVYRM